MWRGKCLNDAGNRTANGTPVNLGACNGSSSQKWTVVQDRTLRIHGKCLGISGSAKVSGAKAVLATCSGYASQQWPLAPAPNWSMARPACAWPGPVPAPARPGVDLPLQRQVNQKWTQPAGPVVSEVPGTCLNDQGGSSADANPVVIWSCDGQSAQNRTAVT